MVYCLHRVKEMKEMFECNLPPYLAHDLEAWKKGVEEHVTEKYL